MPKRKKRKFRFYWEEPEQLKKPEKREKDLFEEPFEFRFTFPRIRFPEMRRMPVNIAETNKQVIVKAELPGFKKEEINLNVTEGTIEISAAKRQEKVEEGEKYFRQEKKAGAIRRSFTLPAIVDPDKTEATLADSVLTIIMPKAKEIKKKKKVEVK
jgi:HSP20 family protein